MDSTETIQLLDNQIVEIEIPIEEEVIPASEIQSEEQSIFKIQYNTQNTL